MDNPRSYHLSFCKGGNCLSEAKAGYCITYGVCSQSYAGLTLGYHAKLHNIDLNYEASCGHHTGLCTMRVPTRHILWSSVLTRRSDDIVGLANSSS